MTPQDPDHPIPPPLKRHAVLQPLSREHMGGLIQARNLQRAADMTEPDRLRAIGEFMDTWRAEIKDHFDDEERLLLPLTDSPEMRQRLLHEHRALRDLANQCEHNPAAVAADAPLVRRIGVLLHDHIRWEEREYFEALQRDHPEALAALEHDSALIEHRRPGSRPRR